MAGHFSTMFGTPSFGYENNHVPFQDFAATSMENNLYIDPTLADQWITSTQRFLNDPNTKAFFNTHTHTSMGVSPLPPATQQRFGSPMSSHELSSASGGGQSPGPTETESYYENPGTPPEVPSVFSPVPQFDDFSSTHAIRFTGSGMMPSYGPLTDANNMNSLYSETDMDYSQGMFFDSSHPSTQCNMVTSQGAVVSEFNRLASPVENMPLIKEEIEAATTYSPLPKREPEHDNDPSSEEESSLPRTPKRQSDEEDGDYRPSKKSRPNNNKAAPIPRRPAGNPTQVWHSQLPKRTAATKPSLPANLNPRRITPSSVHFKCPDCSRTDFSDRTDFETHVKKQHTRPFTCVFHFAGCESTFAAKNEWKRHASTQHLLLDFWLCTEGVCAKTCNASSAHSCPLPNGAIFNRKDLYTQHIKRMHMPANIKKLTSNNNNGTKSRNSGLTPVEKEQLGDWELKVRELQERGKKERCKLPTVMQCPVEGCKQPEFKGLDAWDQRMEHVAKHLEAAAVGREEQVVFGGESDGSLVGWAKSREVGIIERGRGGKWELRKVLERQGGGGQQVRGGMGGRGQRVREEIVVRDEEEGEEEEEDAEGEEDADGEVE
ncbi:hypothetical protein QBC40DRAFT_253808 [Triangularia verruculosa]|uniref:C2H2-type domain-containing protein n=1 Tax=Triangularia verruculosa TaxID=2587418 RepID=A0AAN7AVJ1_9PEZI|nr:hypothetical protein QBC40DRAFT_253808 [Triangularia verruculosa]